MKLNQTRTLSYFTFYILCISYVSCNKAHLVRQGAITKAALHEAISLCPKFIDGKRKAEYIRNINDMFKPAFTASDPNRKLYEPDYIPSTEERREMAVKLCQGHGNANSFRNVPDETSLEPITAQKTLIKDEDELYAHQDAMISPLFLDSKYFIFLFGTVFGMLLVFIYFHVKDSSVVRVSSKKSLRRPEL